MQTTPVLETLLQNIESALKDITRNNNYRSSVKLVSRILMAPEDVPDDKFPALFISLGPGDLGVETNRSIANNVSIVIRGYVKFNEHASKEDIASVQLIKLMADVTEAMFDDPDRNNLANEQDIISFLTDAGTLEPYAAFELQFHVRTSYTATNNGERV